MMTLMEYGSSQYASSTMSSSTTLSGSCGSGRTPRIRTIRLVRPANATLPPPSLTCRHGPTLGFSVRGGREHGTGFFVSHVEVGSEAQRQGLRIGDQIIRVNGFTVEDAVHKEVLQLISNHTHLTFKVRSVGMIPVKDKRTNLLSWQIVTDNTSMRSTPPLSEKIQDVRINIIVAPRSKLGCGICKGPDWRPGIFIQFTKEGGIAREAGLRPGDQIISCNGVDFSEIPFNEAVSLMKSSRQLELVVRKSAGSDLFPGESSGYNSSASSVTGDQSPSWSDSKRLSIVKEENLDSNKKSSKNWEDEVKQIFKPTVINLSENGTTIRNNGSEEECQSVLSFSQAAEKKTVVVEVHRSEEAKTEKNPLTKSSSSSSFISLAGSTTSGSLSSAISLEIQRRSELKKVSTKPSIDEQLQASKILKGVDSDKYSQHNKLMDEFKKAHRRMFNSQEERKETADRMAEKVSERLTEAATSPPPPPPPPCEGPPRLNKKGKAPPVPPVKTSTLSFNQPPPCPPPDYDGFKRPVSVTIGEYPSGTLRKAPGKLDFLNGEKDGVKSGNTPISSQLASELAQTLSRSNLRKRTESVENLLNCHDEEIKTQSNGSIRISLNANLAKFLARSVDDLTAFEDFANRVTININSDKKSETLNGILKSGGQRPPLLQQKSITFGETPTVINDPQAT